MKQPIRAFAVGLFTAALVMLIVNYFSNGSTQDLSEMPIEDVVEELKEQGYRVLSESEYISLSINEDSAEEPVENTEKDDTAEVEEDDSSAEEDLTEPEDSTSEETGDAEENKESQSEEAAKSFTLSINSGMPSSAISNELEENGIIDNSNEFINYLEEEGYAERIQLGEFTLTSDMSFYDIAEALTK